MSALVRPGRRPSGPANAITDVGGVSVGHFELPVEGLHTGLTAVLPYPAGTALRRVFAGRWALDRGGSMTGEQATEDFGTLSSPIVLASDAAVGVVYEELITLALRRDSGLSTSGGWPPVVLGLDDALWNAPATVYAAVQRDHVQAALGRAAAGAVGQGSVGIGLGLCAFGLAGGVGTASRRVGSGEVVGVLVAANGGQPGALRVGGAPLGDWLAAELQPGAAPLPRSFAAVLATDAPLSPLQLDHLCERAALGLARIGLLGPDEAVDRVATAGDELLLDLASAAAEAAEEAVLNALLAAGPALERTPRLTNLEGTGWRAQVERWQQAR